MPHPIAELRLSRAVVDAEERALEAMEASARLMLEMIEVRRATGSPAHIGHSALASLAKSMVPLADAQNAIFRTHRELVKVRTDMSDPQAMIDHGNCELKGSAADRLNVA